MTQEPQPESHVAELMQALQDLQADVYSIGLPPDDEPQRSIDLVKSRMYDLKETLRHLAFDVQQIRGTQNSAATKHDVLIGRVTDLHDDIMKLDRQTSKHLAAIYQRLEATEKANKATQHELCDLIARTIKLEKTASTKENEQ